MPNFSSLGRLEVPEKFLWVGGGWWWGGVCKVIFVSNPTVVLCCVGVGVLTIILSFHMRARLCFVRVYTCIDCDENCFGN